MPFNSQHIPKRSWEISTQIGPTYSALRVKTVVRIQSYIAIQVASAKQALRQNMWTPRATWRFANPMLLILTPKKNVASTARRDTTWTNNTSMATHSARLVLRIRECTKMSWDKLLASSVEQGSCRVTYICKQNLPSTEHANDARTDDISMCSMMLLLLPIRFVFVMFFFLLTSYFFLLSSFSSFFLDT